LKKACRQICGTIQDLGKKRYNSLQVGITGNNECHFSMFHVSQLKKCLRVPEERIEPRGIKLKSDLVYREQPVRVLDTKERATRNSVVKTYKIQWNHHDEGDVT
jgi:hypothetical protein